jgi:hypothetical protein
MFQIDQQIMLISKTDREATDTGLIIDRACENLPSWLKPKKDGKWNDHLKMFTETGSAIKFYSPEAARGKAVTFLIIDEAAFIDDMEKHWKAMWPVLSTGGSCTVISTVNGVGNWYEQTYNEAKDGLNKFHVIDLDYWEHPDYNDEEWVKDQKAQLGEKGFAQEVLRQFQGSGETYFPTRIITKLSEICRSNYPSRKLFPKWVNQAGKIAQLEQEHNRGALWIFKEPIVGHEYIIGVDCAEGQGEKNDSSSFQIIDTYNLEQVAEFYSNLIVPNEYAQVINEIGIVYNNALVAVENMGPGSAVLSTLQHTLYYENLYFDGDKATKPGFKMGPVNRPLYLESLQNHLINDTVKINSMRFVSELQTFEYNKAAKKAQAQKGCHDDAIIAMCIALHTRDVLSRGLSLSPDQPQKLTGVKSEVYEEIRRELMEGKIDDFMNDEDLDLLSYNRDSAIPDFILNRPHANILKEFGW